MLSVLPTSEKVGNVAFSTGETAAILEVVCWTRDGDSLNPSTILLRKKTQGKALLVVGETGEVAKRPRNTSGICRQRRRRRSPSWSYARKRNGRTKGNRRGSAVPIRAVGVTLYEFSDMGLLGSAETEKTAAERLVVVVIAEAVVAGREVKNRSPDAPALAAAQPSCPTGPAPLKVTPTSPTSSETANHGADDINDDSGSESHDENASPQASAPVIRRRGRTGDGGDFAAVTVGYPSDYDPV
ncbi:hypothetical protein MAPG_11321 [Magnaporthiopsis poae ATCC 64411]|uniref:Uncharacterized protein n=1 Tax=Magnaporthiopsis poae (strain ATCC 64411 / 73-15) TaxID=644358 RepID=A0A0C4EEY9_MAGP6|nr:hypothetical protein MAPG_11321 [Magnaporthiopsis poae ATCC 64411]